MRNSKITHLQKCRMATKLRQLLTVVVTSSPVPSNPATATLHAVFASLELVRNLNRCPKLIQFDGPQAHASNVMAPAVLPG